MIRIVPVLLLIDGMVVRTNNFARPRPVGNAVYQAERVNSWPIDEMFCLDISKSEKSPQIRSDFRFPLSSRSDPLVAQIAEVSTVPLAWGGNIRTYGQMAHAIEFGADKVICTTLMETAPQEIYRGACQFGQQAISVGIDYRMRGGVPTVFVEGGRRLVPVDFYSWIDRAIELGAGEVILHAIDRDGAGTGYDIELLKTAIDRIEVPVVALGGAATPMHLAEAASLPVSAVGAANMWSFSDNVATSIRNVFQAEGIQVRRV